MTSRVRNRIRIIGFIVLSLVAFGVIIHATYNQKTLPTLKNLSIVSVLALLLAWFLNLTFDALSLKIFIAGSGAKLKMKHAYATSAVRILFNMLTPFSFGGQPFMVYFLNTKAGLPAGKTAPAVMTKLLTLSFFGFLGALAAVIIFPKDEVSKVLSHSLTISLVICSVFVAGIVIALLFPKFLIGFFILCGRIFHKITRKKTAEGHLQKTIILSVIEAKKSFRMYFKRSVGHFILGTFFSLLMYLSDIIIIYLAVESVAPEHIPLIKGLSLSAFVEILIVFLPTPGSSGLGEAVFALVFSLLAPTYVLGIAVVIWRFFYSYISVLIGAVIMAKSASSPIDQVNEKKTIPDRLN